MKYGYFALARTDSPEMEYWSHFVGQRHEWTTDLQKAVLARTEWSWISSTAQEDEHLMTVEVDFDSEGDRFMVGIGPVGCLESQ